MADEWPKIRARRITRLSPWTELVARDVEFAPGAPVQTYHYISILALTPSQQIPLVRQYRPALETMTWELPAGMVDDAEDPAETCRRELLEETGFPALTVRPLGTFSPCPGRLSNLIHSFFVTAGERLANHPVEAGIEVKLVTPAELAALIKSGGFDAQQQLGTLMLARLHGLLDLPVA
jgi:ADP-ribose pyrophosphatase